MVKNRPITAHIESNTYKFILETNRPILGLSIAIRLITQLIFIYPYFPSIQPARKPMSKGVLEFTLNVAVDMHKEGQWYVAHCPVLDISSQGTTEQEALDNLSDALHAFVLSCFERGVLEQALKDCGFRPGSPDQQVFNDTERYLKIPISLLAAGPCNAQAATG